MSDMKVAGFKVWYADGSVVVTENWKDLPSDEVQIVCTYFEECYEEDKHYRCMDDGCDWYWFDGEKVQTVRSKDTQDEWQTPPDIDSSLLKRGTIIDEVEFKNITDKAMVDVRWHELS